MITIAGLFGATDIEWPVTFPMELANSSISGLKEMRSFSRFGLLLVAIVFDDRIDIYGPGENYQYVVRPEKGSN